MCSVVTGLDSTVTATSASPPNLRRSSTPRWLSLFPQYTPPSSTSHRMDPVLPPNTPAGLAYTPGFVLHPESQIRPIGLISPKKNGVIRSTVAGQMQDCLSNVADAFAAYGPNAKLVKVTRLMTDVRDVWPVQLVIDEHFGSRSILPTSTLIEVPACSEPGIRIEVDL